MGQCITGLIIYFAADAGTKIHYLVTVAHIFKHLATGLYMELNLQVQTETVTILPVFKYVLGTHMAPLTAIVNHIRFQ